jgi:hypothetical protein
LSLADQVPETEDLMDQEDDAPIVRLINALLSEATLIRETSKGANSRRGCTISRNCPSTRNRTDNFFSVAAGLEDHPDLLSLADQVPETEDLMDQEDDAPIVVKAPTHGVVVQSHVIVHLPAIVQIISFQKLQYEL